MSTAVTHQGDPKPAHDAARAHNRSGRTATNLQTVLRAVQAHPGLTAPELGEIHTTLGHIEAQRRLSDLARDRGGKVVEKGDRRMCAVRKKRLTTWWPRRKQGELF